MKIRGFGVVFMAMVAASAPSVAQELPNIVIIYADDLGYGDLSVYNAEAAYQTPRLDRLAAEGIRFVDAHSPCTICSPSRYGLLSGELICRTGRRPTAFEGPGGPSYLAPGQLTLAEMLRRQGYRTGVFGKWHLGLTWYDRDGERLEGGFENSLRIDYSRSTPLEDGPNERGFDESFVTPNCPTTDPLYIYIENGMVPVPASQRHRSESLPNPGGKWRWDNDEGWMSPDYRFVDADLLFYEKTIQFIRGHRSRFPDRPFFVLFSTQISHAPVLPAEEFRGATSAGPRGDFVRELDTLTGRLLNALEDLGIDDNTLVIFHSDNGPETVHTDWMRQDHQHDPAGGFRGMKRDGWEGGHRVPLLARWPARIPAGQVSSQLVNTTDLFATLASLVSYELPDNVAVDSYDLLPAMVGIQKESEPIRPYMLTQSFRGEFQLRQGPWKYLAHRGSGGNHYDQEILRPYALVDTAPEAAGQLYHLVRDPGETTNLFFSEAARREQMHQLLEELTRKDGRTARTGRRPMGIRELPLVQKPAVEKRLPEAVSPRPVLQVINGSRQPVQVFWLKTDEERILNGTVAPGTDTVISTTLGHRFAIVGQEDDFEVTATSTVPVQAIRFDPPDLEGVPAFYTQRVRANGFPIVASAKVNPYALKEAAYLVDLMLAKRPDVREAMIRSGARLCVLAHDEFTTDQPEFARLGRDPGERFPGVSGKDFWDARARGMGGSERDPICSCAEENLLGYPNDPYAAECILIHELAHNIHLRGMVNVDPSFDARLKATFDAAMAAGLWKGKYASVNHHEYFAEGVQSWFDNNRENDHDHNHVNTRNELVEYDPRLADICREVFGETEFRYTKPSTRLQGHLQGYDPSTAPPFAWPERLKNAREQIRRSAQQRDRNASQG